MNRKKVAENLLSTKILHDELVNGEMKITIIPLLEKLLTQCL